MHDASKTQHVLAAATLVAMIAGGLNTFGTVRAASTKTGIDNSALVRSVAAAKPAARVMAQTVATGFERNQGQVDRRVRFLAHGRGYTLFLTGAGAVLNLSARHVTPAHRGYAAASTRGGDVVRLSFVGAVAHPRVSGLDRLPTKLNYLIGSHKKAWKTNVHSYARVAYTGLYRGVDIVYHGSQNALEYDVVVQPETSPRAIMLSIAGARQLTLSGDGALLLHLSSGILRQGRPVVYQIVRGKRRAVSTRYVLAGPHTVRFAMGRYDRHIPLVIDPTLSYAVYLGGTGDGSDSGGAAVTTDGAGDVYVTGTTTATSFPTTTGAYSTTTMGNTDAFVTKLSPSGAIIYSTYLGGADDDAGRGAAVDPSGAVYLTGATSSTNFPTTTGAYSPTNSGGTDAFVAKLSADGSSLLYSTYLGGTDTDSGAGIAVEGADNVFVVGATSSRPFPTTTTYRDASNNQAVFVANLNTAGSGRSALRYSTVLGGSDFDTAGGIAVDSTGAAYVTGSTSGTNFPITAGAYSTGARGSANAFVAKVATSGTLVYSTILGGSGDDHGNAIAVNGAGDAYVTGSTTSSNFPVLNSLPASGATCSATSGTNGGADAFVSAVNSTGTGLLYSTYLGGKGTDVGQGITVDDAGAAYVTGSTSSTNYPTTTDAYISTSAGGYDAFLTKLTPSGSSLLYSTYLGGSSDDAGYGVAADNSNDVVVTGQTYSAGVTTGATSGNASGSSSAFVVKITGTASGSSMAAPATPSPACTAIPPTSTSTVVPPTATAAPATLQAYYTFDATPLDSSGNNHTGTLQGAAIFTTTSKVGAGALSLNGSNGSDFSIPGQVLNTLQSYSVAAWVNLNVTSSGFQTVACIEANQGCAFYLQVTPDGKFAMSALASDTSGAGGIRALSTTMPATGTYYHLVGVYDAVAQQLRLYVNGRLEGTTSYTSAYQGTGATLVGRGKYNNSPGDYLNGLVDDAHFYQGILTDAQIAVLAGSAAPTSTAAATSTPSPTSTATLGSAPATPGTTNDTTSVVQGSQDSAPASTNLTTEGTTDWIEWGDQPAATNTSYTTDYNRKANVAPSISTFAPIGYGTATQSSGGGSIVTWSDGTPAQSGANNGQGVYVSGNGNDRPSSGSGFQFTVLADTTTRELRVYVNVSHAAGRLTASLGDNSAPIYSDSSLSAPSGTQAGVYTLYYRASSPGQTLTIDWENAVDYGGGVTLEAATLQQVTTIPPTATATPVPPTATIVPLTRNAFYAFDEGSGTTANDSSGNGHTGTLMGDATYAAPGQDNSPYDLKVDGSSNPATFVDVRGPVINTAESYTVGAWVNISDTNGFHSAVSIDGQHISAFFLQYCGQCGKFAFAVSQSDVDNAATVRAQAIGSPQINTWYYLTGVYDAANQQISLYVDGVLQDTESDLGAFQATGDTVIGRGRYNDNPVDYLPGQIDQVCFYQGVLSSAQISAHTCAMPPMSTATSTPATPTSTPATPTSTPATPTSTPATPTSTSANTTVPTATGAAVSTATNTSAPTKTPTSTSVPSATSTSVPSATSTSVPSATSTSVPSATSTSVPTATGTPVPSATSTLAPTTTATTAPTATSTPVPTTTGTPVLKATMTSTSSPTSVPSATSLPTSAPTSTATEQPGSGACYVKYLLIDDGLSKHGRRVKRAVAVVEQLRTPTVGHKAPYSSTPLYFDDGRRTLFFSRLVYTALACGKHTLLDVSGTIHEGLGVRHSGKTTRMVNLYNVKFELWLYPAKSYKGHARYNLHVQIPFIGYDKTFHRLQGTAEIYRS